jgi:hypothetical protein
VNKGKSNTPCRLNDRPEQHKSDVQSNTGMGAPLAPVEDFLTEAINYRAALVWARAAAVRRSRMDLQTSHIRRQ